MHTVSRLVQSDSASTSSCNGGTSSGYEADSEVSKHTPSKTSDDTDLIKLLEDEIFTVKSSQHM